VSSRRPLPLPVRAGPGPRRRKGGPQLGERLHDEARFLRSWLDNPLAAGAIAPSGPALARAMAAAVDPRREGPVVELGPGTGPVTQALIEAGIDEDRLVLVEYDADFVTLLSQRYPRARVLRGDAYALAETLQGALDTPAAAVVSSLPLLTRPEAERIGLLADAFRVLQPGAPFVQFTYGLVSPVPREAGGFTATVAHPVWRNIPPARVWTYRADGSGRTPSLPAWRADIIDRVRDEWRERTARVRSEWAERTGKMKADLRRTGTPGRPGFADHAPGAERESRVDSTLALLRRLAVHMETGPDVQIAADRDLRRKASHEARRP
jgi:phosphatidylethanolamine/phosphatidyl-N-methylethanolamine N-methyltransferase